MLKSCLCGYSGTYNLFIGTLTVPKRTAVGAAANNANKKVIIKNCAPFTDCISEIDTLVDNAKDADVIIIIIIIIISFIR